MESLRKVLKENKRETVNVTTSNNFYRDSGKELLKLVEQEELLENVVEVEIDEFNNEMYIFTTNDEYVK